MKGFRRQMINRKPGEEFELVERGCVSPFMLLSFHTVLLAGV